MDVTEEVRAGGMEGKTFHFPFNCMLISMTLLKIMMLARITDGSYSIRISIRIRRIIAFIRNECSELTRRVPVSLMNAIPLADWATNGRLLAPFVVDNKKRMSDKFPHDWSCHLKGRQLEMKF